MDAVRLRSVPVEEPLVSAFDYADSFEAGLPAPDARRAEQWVRCGLEGAPRAVRWVIRTAHRRVLRLRLGPEDAPDHILGWPITADHHDVVRLEAVAPLLRAVIVGRRVDPRTTRLTTALSYSRPCAARLLWAVVGPVHRRVAPYLLDRAARATVPG